MNERDERETGQTGVDAASPDTIDEPEDVDAGASVRGIPIAADPGAIRDHQLESAHAEVDRLQDQVLRRQAELVNYRRRAERERAEIATVARANLLEGLVPVVDDFERAVEVESGDVQTYREGMQLILRRLHQALERAGVERFEPAGEAFDPEVHEAIARHQTDDVPEGQVLEVFQAGYKLNDRLIRPASVVVAFGGEASATEDSGTDDEAAPGTGETDDG